MQQAEEAAAEAETECQRGLRLVDQRGVVELEPVERVAQEGVVGPVDREQAGEHHRLGVAVAAEVLRGGLGRVGDGVTHPRLPDVLDAGDEVPDLPHAEALGRLGLRRADADLEQLVVRPGGHHHDLLARAEVPVDDAHVRDDAAVGVVDGVEDHRAGRGVRVADRSRHLLDDPVEQLGDARAGLARGVQHLRGIAPDEVRQLVGVLLRLRGGQVDLVEHRHDRELVLHRQVEVGEGLRLDALRGVDEQDGALARGQRARHLVGEVDVAGGVDHVEGEGVPGDLPGHPDGLRLDRDAALALDVHPVEVLRPHVARLDHAGDLQHPVGQRRLAVVDVGDDAEVADHRRRGRGGHERRAGHRGHGGSYLAVGETVGRPRGARAAAVIVPRPDPALARAAVVAGRRHVECDPRARHAGVSRPRFPLEARVGVWARWRPSVPGVRDGRQVVRTTCSAVGPSSSVSATALSRPVSLARYSARSARPTSARPVSRPFHRA